MAIIHYKSVYVSWNPQLSFIAQMPLLIGIRAPILRKYAAACLKSVIYCTLSPYYSISAGTWL